HRRRTARCRAAPPAARSPPRTSRPCGSGAPPAFWKSGESRRPPERPGRGSDRSRGASCAPTAARRVESLGLPSLLLLLLGAALGATFSRGRLGLTLRCRAFGAVTAEQPRRGELAQLVTHHVLGDVDGDELVPVVHREGVADEVRRDRAAARPRLEDFLFVPLVEGANLHHQRLFNVWPFFYATSHELSISDCGLRICSS